MSGLLGAVKAVARPIYDSVKDAEFLVRRRLGLFQTTSALASEAHAFWNGSGVAVERSSHWRGTFDDQRWLALGREHLSLFEAATRLADRPRRLRRMLEWGCGGGANAVHFAPLCDAFLGADISQATVDECARQVAGAGSDAFVPVLIDTLEPERTPGLTPASLDLFLSTYVFELLPTPEYGLRILGLAHRLLEDGGLAIMQIRYRTQSWRSESKRFDYRRNFVTMTTYAIDEFWSEAERIGFKPLAVKLVPKQPLVEDGDYAYYLMQK